MEEPGGVATVTLERLFEVSARVDAATAAAVATAAVVRSWSPARSMFICSAAAGASGAVKVTARRLCAVCEVRRRVRGREGERE